MSSGVGGGYFWLGAPKGACRFKSGIPVTEHSLGVFGPWRSSGLLLRKVQPRSVCSRLSLKRSQCRQINSRPDR